jgi:hypothetical protein
MSKLPEDILNKIMLFNSHPIADIMKESSIFKYLQLRELYFKHIEEGTLVENYVGVFTYGCDDGYDNGYHSSICREMAQDGDIEFDEIDKYVEYYDIGFMHTLNKLNDDD